MKIQCVISLDVQPNEIKKSEFEKEFIDTIPELEKFIMEDLIFNQRINGVEIKSKTVFFQKVLG